MGEKKSNESSDSTSKDSDTSNSSSDSDSESSSKTSSTASSLNNEDQIKKIATGNVDTDGIDRLASGTTSVVMVNEDPQISAQSPEEGEIAESANEHIGRNEISTVKSPIENDCGKSDTSAKSDNKSIETIPDNRDKYFTGEIKSSTIPSSIIVKVQASDKIVKSKRSRSKSLSRNVGQDKSSNLKRDRRRREEDRRNRRRSRSYSRSRSGDRRRGERKEERNRRIDSPKRRSPIRQKTPEPANPEVIPPRQQRTVDMLTSKTGGAYIPPAKLRLLQAEITDKSSAAYQRIAWEALKKSIHGHINKVNVDNIGIITRDLLKENIIRGRGLLCRSIIQAQAASPTFTHVYAALVAVINSKFPNIGELLLKRLVIQFKRGFRRNDKPICLSASRFIAHLVNQRVAHEILALEILTLLVETPTDDSVEVAIAFLKECGMKLQEVSSKGVNAIFEMLKNILHEGKLDKRVQYMIEVVFQVRKDGFKDHIAIQEALELVEEDDQFTHLIMLDEATDTQDVLNVFKFDAEYEINEGKYKDLCKELLGSDASNSEDGSGSESEADDDDEEDGDEEKKDGNLIIDQTETNLIALRRTIYLTIHSSLDYEECAHKLMKMELKPGQETELCHMFLDCCAEQRTYEKFYGLLAQRFCMINKIYVGPFEDIFKDTYSTTHRLDTNRLRNVSKFFAHLLFTDAIGWDVFECIRLNEDDTTSSSRIFIKILFQELAEYMGLGKLNARLKDTTIYASFSGLFPRDNPRNTRFAINFFTSIGLGGLTDELREHLKNVPKLMPTISTVNDANKSSSSSSSSSSDSSSSSSSSDSSSSSSESSSSSSSDGKATKDRKKNKNKSKDNSQEKNKSSRRKVDGDDYNRRPYESANRLSYKDRNHKKNTSKESSIQPDVSGRSKGIQSTNRSRYEKPNIRKYSPERNVETGDAQRRDRNSRKNYESDRRDDYKRHNRTDSPPSDSGEKLARKNGKEKHNQRSDYVRKSNSRERDNYDSKKRKSDESPRNRKEDRNRKSISLEKSSPDTRSRKDRMRQSGRTERYNKTEQDKEKIKDRQPRRVKSSISGGPKAFSHTSTSDSSDNENGNVENVLNSENNKSKRRHGSYDNTEPPLSKRQRDNSLDRTKDRERYQKGKRSNSRQRKSSRDRSRSPIRRDRKYNDKDKYISRRKSSDGRHSRSPIRETKRKYNYDEQRKDRRSSSPRDYSKNKKRNISAERG